MFHDARVRLINRVLMATFQLRYFYSSSGKEVERLLVVIFSTWFVVSSETSQYLSGGGERGRALENVGDHVVFRENEGIFFVY